MDILNSIRLRRKQKRKKPTFQRQESRLKKLNARSGKWRQPKGRHSKLRQKEKARGRHPSPGYGSPSQARGLGRSGLREVRISTPSKIKDINPKTEAILISGSVGKAKREKIIEQAKKLGVKISNA